MGHVRKSALQTIPTLYARQRPLAVNAMSASHARIPYVGRLVYSAFIKRQKSLNNLKMALNNT